MAARTVTTAMPVVNAMARAKITAIFFMIVPLLPTSNIHRLAWLSSAHYCSLAYSTYTLVRDESGPQAPRVSRPREKFPRWFPAKPFAAGPEVKGTSAGFASPYLSDEWMLVGCFACVPSRACGFRA
jgi:hypothetical protein